MVQLKGFSMVHVLGEGGTKTLVDRTSQEGKGSIWRLSGGRAEGRRLERKVEEEAFVECVCSR